MAHLNRDFNGVDADLNMSKTRQKPIDSVMPSASKNRLRQKMSEVISLREKVAQAELERRGRDSPAEVSRPRERSIGFRT